MVDRKRDARAGEEESDEAEGEDGVAKARAEILPDWCVGAGVVRGEEQSQHED